MVGDVWIQVGGYHMVDGEAQEPVVTQSRGKYNIQNGKHYLRFEEIGESGQRMQTLMKFKEDYLEVTKKGSIQSNMRFESGRMNTTHYETPVGSIEVGIETANVHVEESPRKITVAADYALYAGGQCVQNSRVEVTVIPYPIV